MKKRRQTGSLPDLSRAVEPIAPPPAPFHVPKIRPRALALSGSGARYWFVVATVLDKRGLKTAER